MIVNLTILFLYSLNWYQTLIFLDLSVLGITNLIHPMYTPIAEFNTSLLNNTEAYIHRAAQFLAMMGKAYLEDVSDDSNANLGFDSESSAITGRSIRGEQEFSFNLNVANWQFEIVRSGQIVSTCPLAGKLKTELLGWLQGEVHKMGLNAEELKFIDHYEVPEHEVDLGHPFQELPIDVVSTWMDMRSNAMTLLSELNGIVGVHSEIRIWPHHFDTGTYYELDNKKAIGAGWAIADTLCENPYLYIYGWNGNKPIDYSDVPILDAGKWILTDDWQGAVIESADLPALSNQLDSIQSFMKSAAGYLKTQLT